MPVLRHRHEGRRGVRPGAGQVPAAHRPEAGRQDRETVSTPFVKTELDENGILKSIRFENEEKFNFAFDIVDKLAEKSPDKLAMLHVSRDKVERRFTFGDISRWSAKTANYLESLGIQRGDRVMVVLKRHYQFWFVITALHKMGAVIIPATNLLMEHDFDYRFKAAGVKAILCTADGQVADEAEKAAKNCPSVEVKIMVGENRLGWHDFDKEVEAFPDTYERKPDAPCGSDPMLMFFTSGTTGYPKIAEHNYKYALGHYITAKYWHNVNPDGLHFTISDTGWGKALWGKYYGQWMNEAAIFTYDFDKFDAHDILPMFAKYHITTFCAPPTMYRFFIKEDLSKYDLSSIEYSTTAGEALNPEVFEQWKRAQPDADGGLRPDGDHPDHLQPRGHRAQARLHGHPQPPVRRGHRPARRHPRSRRRDRRNRGAHGQGRALRPVHGLLPGRGKDQGVLERRPLPHRRHRLAG